MIRSLLFVILTSVPQLLRAQKSMINDKAMHEVIKKGLDKMYNFEFAKAEEYYKELKKDYPDHPAYNFLMASNLYWQMFYNDTYKDKAAEYFKLLEASLAQASKYLEKNSKDVEGVFFTMAIESSIALYYAERDENMKTVSHAKKAYSAMKEGFGLKDSYEDFYFSTGVYDYFVVQYPETHPVYKPFMFFFTKGDKKRGIKELEHGVENGVFSRTECLHYLAHIYLKYENIPSSALLYTEKLLKKYPDNLYFMVRHVEGLIATEKYKEAEFYSYKLYSTGKKPFVMRSYVFYGMLNEKYFKKPDESMRYYKAALKYASELNQPTGDFPGFAYAGIARLYHQQGNTEMAVEYYEKAEDVADYAWLRKEIKEYLDKYD